MFTVWAFDFNGIFLYLKGKIVQPLHLLQLQIKHKQVDKEVKERKKETPAIKLIDLKIVLILPH